MPEPLYSYDANTQVAKVFHRTTGAVVCEVSGVDLYVGNMLSRLAEQKYAEGYERGRRDAVQSMTDHLLRMAQL